MFRHAGFTLFQLKCHAALIVVLGTVLLGTPGTAHSEDWPQWRGPNRDGVWTAQGIVDKLPEGQLPLDWSVEIGTGYSGPTVADGKVYVMDRQAKEADQFERVLCFDSATGKTIWEHRYPATYTVRYTAGPRASVTIDRGIAYAVGAMGHFHALDAKSGKVLWQKDLQKEYDINIPIWGISGSPLIYHDMVIQQVGGSDGACIVAFDRTTGKEVWRALHERASYSSPMLVRQANQDVVVCWTGDSLSGLFPDSGKVAWSESMPPSRMPIGVATPIVDGDRLFVTSFYDGSLMVRLLSDKPGMEKIWRRVGESELKTDAIHSIIGTPVIDGNYVYGVDSHGEFRCLDAKTGERLWESLDVVPKARWSTVHIIRQADRYWLFNERGELMIAQLTPKGITIESRCKVIEPTTSQLNQRGGVVWTHPAFAEQSIFVRNDNRLVKASLRSR